MFWCKFLCSYSLRRWLVKAIGLFRRRESRDPSSNIRFVRSRHFLRYVGIDIYISLCRRIFGHGKFPFADLCRICAELCRILLFLPCNDSIFETVLSIKFFNVSLECSLRDLTILRLVHSREFGDSIFLNSIKRIIKNLLSLEG